MRRAQPDLSPVRSQIDGGRNRTEVPAAWLEAAVGAMPHIAPCWADSWPKGEAAASTHKPAFTAHKPCVLPVGVT